MVLEPAADFAGQDKILVIVTDNASTPVKRFFSNQSGDRDILGKGGQSEQSRTSRGSNQLHGC